MKIYLLLAAIVVLLVVGWLFMGKPANVSAPEQKLAEPTPAIGTAPQPVPASSSQGKKFVSASVVYIDSGFSPTTLTVKAGTVVNFENKSSAPFWPASAVHPDHRVYDGTPLGEHCKSGATPSFDSCGGIAPGATWPFKFDKVGSWKYHDHLNAGRFGMIVVQ